jgi:hypothetical protein
MNNVSVRVAVGSKAIGVVRHSTPRCVATKAALCKIDVKDNLPTGLYIRIVHLLLREARIEILRAVRHRTDTQRLKALNAHASATIIGKLKPAYIALITRLLWADIRE